MTDAAKQTNDLRPVPHFVAEYQRLVTKLLDTHSLDEAMSLAVGGTYEKTGEAQANILVQYGLREDHSLVDIGCGSGRLSSALGRRLRRLYYLGTDIDLRLLQYAAGRAPANFRFLLHQQLSIPVEDASVDFIVFFSVFTHLFHEESYIYLQDAKRALRPGGTVKSVLPNDGATRPRVATTRKKVATPAVKFR